MLIFIRDHLGLTAYLVYPGGRKMVLASQGLYFLIGFNPKALSPTFSPNNTNTKGGLNYK